jgi:hypothetical protein
MMLLLIPAGEEGKNYCQSCLRIRSVMVLDGKDTEDICHANFPDISRFARTYSYVFSYKIRTNTVVYVSYVFVRISVRILTYVLKIDRSYPYVFS